ncbi:MAG: hypothetical protein ACLSA2_05840 [Candidatus Gastranaerophilaceae bacterium]
MQENNQPVVNLISKPDNMLKPFILRAEHVMQTILLIFITVLMMKKMAINRM